ncbi:MAG TPA: peptide ABC transporter substrate-binding protein [Opitutus sp.]|nr:peptide ABC transporter substrate-binding protein [Opitutus sp.]
MHRLRFTLLLLMAVAGFLVSSCSRREAPVDTAIAHRTLLLGNLSEPADLDPHLATAYTDQNILVALFEGLTALDEKSSLPVPAGAERWDVSADGLVSTFHLRHDARWSNGDPVRAPDFAYSFRRILSPALGSEYAYMLWPIKNAEAFNRGQLAEFSEVGVSVLDDATLRLTLERPTPYLLSLAAHPTWFPVHRGTVEKFGRIDQRSTGWTRAGQLVGNGAFILAEWSPNARLVAAKNPHHWSAAANQLERVIFFPVENADVEERNFRAGQLHLTYGLPIEKIARYREETPAQLRLDPFLQSFFLRFNVTRPPLDQPQLRRALALAIDRDALTRSVLRGSRPPASHFVPPDCAGYTSRAQVRTDLAEARRLLAEAGFPGGQNLPTLELQVRNDDTQPKVAEALQAMWQRELGVRVTLAPFEQKTWVQNQQSLAYTISFAAWAGDFADPATFLDLFVSGGGNNWTGWADADYDRLLANAARTADHNARHELFQQAEARLLEQAPITPLYFGARTYLIHPAVKNWQPSLLGFHRYQLVRLDPAGN